MKGDSFFSEILPYPNGIPTFVSTVVLFTKIFLGIFLPSLSINLSVPFLHVLLSHLRIFAQVCTLSIADRCGALEVQFAR
jgi:hypothetical protein